MIEKQTNKMSVWLFKRPAIFALLSMLFLFVATLIGGLLSHILGLGEMATRVVMGIFVTIAFFGATAVTVRMLPGDNLDRRSFVALNTAQMFITSVVFIITTLIVITNANSIMMRLLWMESHSTMSFLLLMILLSMFYMFLCGIYIGNLYAKYRRIRAMGVSMWRALATAPFGFCMLWIPGYLMDDAKKTTPAIDIKSKWYARTVNWIMARPAHSAGVLVALLLMSGFFMGFNAIMFTLVAALIFVIWAIITGYDVLRKNIGGRYTTVAIVINVIIIITVVGMITMARNSTPKPNTYAPDVQIQIQE